MSTNRATVRVLTTAALRAAVAWTRRETEPGAWRELSRMSGVMMHALGPGRGPAGPVDVVRSLRRPLGQLLGDDVEVDALRDLVLLDEEDQLGGAAIEVACEYTEALFDGDDPDQAWLPSWAWQRAEQVQRSVFAELISSGTDQDYTAARRFLIESPAGDRSGLVERMNLERIPRVARYEEIPPDRCWEADGEAWWWPCPVCRWPMELRGERVECGYSHHQASFRHDPAAKRAPVPRLVSLSTTRRRTPQPLPADGAVCVELAVWRFITVPGVPELDLARRLRRLEGVEVEMWPGKDRVDLAVHTSYGRNWEVDVKDHVDPFSIAESPPAAPDIVVPDYRRAQVQVLSRLLPEKRVTTISGFARNVRNLVLRGAA